MKHFPVTALCPQLFQACSDTVPGWVARYIDIPFVEKGRTFEGCDCYGLVRLVYLEMMGLELPDYSEAYIDTKDNFGMVNLFMQEKQAWNKFIGPPTIMDAIILRIEGYPIHCGIVVTHDRMLHIQRGCNSVHESFKSLLWKNRIVGFYRYGCL